MFSLRNVSHVFFSILLVQIIKGNVIPQEENASNDTSSDPSPNVSLNGPMQINGAHYFFTSPRRSGISIKGEQEDVTNEEAVDSVEADNSEEFDEDPQVFVAPPSDQSIESGEADEFKDIEDAERGGSDDDLGNYDDYGFFPDFFEHIEEPDEGDLSDEEGADEGDFSEEEVTEEIVEPLGVFDDDTEEFDGTDVSDSTETDDFADELDEDVTEETDKNEDGDFIDFAEDGDNVHDGEVFEETDGTEGDEGTDETDFTEEDVTDEDDETQSEGTISRSTQTEDNIESNGDDEHTISRRELPKGDNVTETTSTGTGSEDITAGFKLPEKTEGTPETATNETVPAL